MTPSNILIIKLKHLGDVLTTTPLISGIRQAWPGARISYLVNPGSEDLVRFDPDVHEVLTVPRTGGLGPQLTLIRTLRRNRYDAVFELSDGDRGAFLARATGAKIRVGYQPKKKGIFSRRWAFSRLMPSVTAHRHTVELHLDALRALGVDPGFQPLRLFWPPEAARRVADMLKNAGLQPDTVYAVVHPSSRWMFKAWTPEGNAAVIDYLAENAGRVVLTAAPEKKELAFIQDVLKHVEHEPVDLTGELSLTEMAALIAGARLFFGVDSLPMHMAAAVNTPAVALFGPSGEKNWAPWGRGHQVIVKDWECRPCGRAGCDDSKVSRCLMEIAPEEVYPALDAALETHS